MHEQTQHIFAEDFDKLFKDGFQYLHNGNASKAIQSFDRAALQGKKIPNLHFARATALWQLGELSSAKAACKDELSLGAENIPAINLLERIEKLELELVRKRQDTRRLSAITANSFVTNAARPVCPTMKQVHMLDNDAFREHLRANTLNDNRPCKLQKFVSVAHKSASVYVFKVLSELAGMKGFDFIDFSIAYRHYTKNPNPNLDFDDFILLNKNANMLYLAGRGNGAAATAGFCKSNNIPYKSVNVVRDPRDMIISLYFSKKYSHNIHTPKMQAQRDFYMSMGLDEGITATIDQFEDTIALYLCNWQSYFDNPKVLFLNYEFMKSNSLMFFSTLMKFLEIDVSVYILGDALEKLNFTSLSGRKTGNEDTKHQYRKGIVGDWKNYFKDHHIKHFFSKPNCSKAFYGFGYDNQNK